MEFDRKVVQHPSNLYSENNKEAWSKIRSYLIGERWEMKNLPTWAENWQKVEIPEHEVACLQGAMTDVGFDPVQANH